MKKFILSALLAPLAVAFLMAVSAPQPATASSQHCHLYSGGLDCDHTCELMDICCDKSSDCGEA